MTWQKALPATLLLPAFAASTTPDTTRPHVGDTYRITADRESNQRTDDQSTGSSTDRDTVIERVIAVREGGLELEYDLPTNATSQERASDWQFPARIYRPFNGSANLLNGPELEGRINRWLKAAKMTRPACGHWIFTWNAFRIECDPQSVLRTIEHFNADAGQFRDGALYQDPMALGPVPVKRNGATFSVEMVVAPAAVRRARAESDVAVAEISRESLTLEDALRTRAAEEVSGTITITLQCDEAGAVQRQPDSQN